MRYEMVCVYSGRDDELGVGVMMGVMRVLIRQLNYVHW